MTFDRPTRIFFAIAAFFAASSAWAQSENAVIVLPHGGGASVEVHDLVNGAPTQLGSERFSSNDSGEWTGTDIKRLPNGGHLLAQASGAGVAIFNPDGSLQYTYDPELRYREIASASVAGYLALGEPSRVLIADSFSSALVIRDIKANQLVWYQSMQVAGRFGEFAQAIVMPGGRVVSATSWVENSRHAIDVFTFAGAEVSQKEFANFVDVEAPADTTALTELEDGLRDIFGTADGKLLVTTNNTIFLLSLDGNIEWLFDTREDVNIAGTLGQAKMLPSGNVAFTTYAPGFWIESHPNHRVHWFDPSNGVRLGSTTALTRAPASLDVYDGHGATGTADFLAGIDEIELGDPAKIVAAGLTLGAEAFVPGDILRPRVVWLNEGDYVVATRSLSVVAYRGECTDREEEGIVLAESADIALVPATSFVTSNTLTVGPRFELGQWCAVAEVVDRNGTLLTPRLLPFEVVEASSDTSSVDVNDLDFQGEDLDMGLDAGDAGDVPPPGGEDGGCCATANSANPVGDILLALLALVIGGVRRPWGRGRARR